MMNERRKSKRVEILDRIHGHVVALDVAVTVLEMSLGGMRLETSFRFPTGSEHDFRLQMGDGSPLVLRGRVVRCLENIDRYGSTRYVSGIKFIDEEPPDGDGPVGGLLHKIA